MFQLDVIRLAKPTDKMGTRVKLESFYSAERFNGLTLCKTREPATWIVCCKESSQIARGAVELEGKAHEP